MGDSICSECVMINRVGIMDVKGFFMSVCLIIFVLSEYRVSVMNYEIKILLLITIKLKRITNNTYLLIINY